MLSFLSDGDGRRRRRRAGAAVGGDGRVEVGVWDLESKKTLQLEPPSIEVAAWTNWSKLLLPVIVACQLATSFCGFDRVDDDRRRRVIDGAPLADDPVDDVGERCRWPSPAAGRPSGCGIPGPRSTRRSTCGATSRVGAARRSACGGDRRRNSRCVVPDAWDPRYRGDATQDGGKSEQSDQNLFCGANPRMLPSMQAPYGARQDPREGCTRSKT